MLKIELDLTQGTYIIIDKEIASIISEFLNFFNFLFTNKS